MDIKEGHPGAIFHWFFETDHGKQAENAYLFMLLGSSRAMQQLVVDCMKEQEAFNDILGQEILFLFFDPDIPVGEMFESGRAMRHQLTSLAPAHFLFSGMGEAHPMLPGMTEIGKHRFRSERPGDYYFDKLSEGAARAHARAIPFFQEALNVSPGANALLFCHRNEKANQSISNS